MRRGRSSNSLFYVVPPIGDSSRLLTARTGPVPSGKRPLAQAIRKGQLGGPDVTADCYLRREPSMSLPGALPGSCKNGSCLRRTRMFRKLEAQGSGRCSVVRSRGPGTVQPLARNMKIRALPTVRRLSPNNHMQRTVADIVHAPNCLAGVGISGSAPQVRRAAADVGS